MQHARPSDTLYLCEMMERLGLEPGAAADPQVSLSHITAYHRCAACPAKPACRDWLDHHAGRSAVPPAFCPNADILFQLELADPSSGPHDAGVKRPT